MADIKQAYGLETDVTITLASLASGSARECTAIDNVTTDKFLDAMVRLHFDVPAGTPASDKAIYVWFYGSADGTNYTDNATGTDAALTMRSPTNLLGPWVVNVPTASVVYKIVIPSVAQFFGGIIPAKWGFVVENKCGIALGATEANHIKKYRGIYATSV